MSSSRPSRRPACGARRRRRSWSHGLAACSSNSNVDNPASGGSAGNAAPVTVRLGLLPEHHPRAGDRRRREGLLPAGARPEQARDGDVQRRARSDRRAVRRLDRRRVRRSQPGGQRVPEVERRGDPHRRRLDVGWRRTRRQARASTSAADLKGKKIATPQLGNTQDVALRSYLKAQGPQRPTRAAAATSRSSRRPTPTRSRSSPAVTSTARGCPSRSSRGMQQESGGKVLVDEKTLWPNGRVRHDAT